MDALNSTFFDTHFRLFLNLLFCLLLVASPSHRLACPYESYSVCNAYRVFDFNLKTSWLLMKCGVVGSRICIHNHSINPRAALE